MTNWTPDTNELAAMASTAGVDLGALAYGNCFLDVGNVDIAAPLRLDRH